MDAEAARVWIEYRSAVEDLYPGAERWGLENVDDASLEDVIRLSEEIEQVCLGAIEAGDEEDATTALILSAAVDANVAADAMVVGFEGLPERDEGMREEALALIESEPLEEGEERPSLRELLLLGDEVFRGEAAAGGAAPPSLARERAQQAVADVVKTASPAASGFALGALTFGGGDLLGLLGEVDLLRDLATRGMRLAHRAAKLAHKAIEKMVNALVGVVPITAGVAGLASTKLDEFLHGTFGGFTERLARSITRAERAETRLDGLLPTGHPELSESKLAKLSTDLDKLERSYEKRIKCARALRTALRVFGPPLCGAPPCVGLAVLAGLNATGLACVLYSLAVRLDNAPGLRTQGIVTVVETII